MSLAFASVQLLPEQCLQGWNETREVIFPKSYRVVSNIVFAGTGGSSLGAEMLLSWGRDNLKVPCSIISSGALPLWIGKRTLVIAVSYSGNTAETIRIAKEAKSRSAKLFVIASGGALAKFAKRYKCPAYIFNDKETNPSGQPRLGVGITFSALLGVFSKYGLLKINESEVEKSVSFMRRRLTAWNTSPEKNRVREIVRSLDNKIPLLIGAEHLTGNLVAFRNQIHENAKQLAFADTLPELNHHLLEGLSHPNATKEIVAVFIQTKSYASEIKKRIIATKEVFRKQNIATANIDLSGPSKLGEVFSLLAFGSLLSLRLAEQNTVDPLLIPWVDFFKNIMSSTTSKKRQSRTLQHF